MNPGEKVYTNEKKRTKQLKERRKSIYIRPWRIGVPVYLFRGTMGRPPPGKILQTLGRGGHGTRANP